MYGVPNIWHTLTYLSYILSYAHLTQPSQTLLFSWHTMNTTHTMFISQHTIAPTIQTDTYPSWSKNIQKILFFTAQPKNTILSNTFSLEAC